MAADAAVWTGPTECRACFGTGLGPNVRNVYGRTDRQAIAEAKRVGRQLGVHVRQPEIDLVSAGRRSVFSHRDAHVTLTFPDWVRTPCGSCRGAGVRRGRRLGAAISR